MDKLPVNTMIDTAEAYGFGKSEELIAGFRKATNTKPVIATKFAPLPWRFTSASVIGALEVRYPLQLLGRRTRRTLYLSSPAGR